MRQKKIQIVLLLVSVIFPLSVLAQDKSFSETHLTAEGQKAYQTLLTAERFEDTYVGYAGSLSKFVAAYRILLGEEKQVEAFKKLIDNATIAGQLYALCGLYDTDYNFFLSVVGKYKASKESVETISGCIVTTDHVGDIIFLDKPNTIRLSSPTQSFDEWREKARITENEGFMMDISGGGYSMMFRERSLAK